DGQIVGRTAYLQPAHVMASPEIIGKVLPVHVESLERYSLLGHLATPVAATPVAATPAFAAPSVEPRMTTGA
ncbi:hypothetical protein ABTH48_20030, partial [Acinetobacter baumannii]